MSEGLFKAEYLKAGWMYEDCLIWVFSHWPRATLTDIFAFSDHNAAKQYMRAFLYETYADYSDRPLHYAQKLDGVIWLVMLQHMDNFPFPIWFGVLERVRNHLGRAIDHQESKFRSVANESEARYWFDRREYEYWVIENTLNCPIEGNEQRIETLARNEQEKLERARRRTLGAPYQNRANIPGDHRETEWLAILAWYGNRCLKCGATTDLCRDHIIPVTWDDATNSYENIQPLCRTCNTQKLNRNKADYRPYPPPSTSEALVDWYNITHAESEAHE